jgi:Ca2+-binding RTX toxin-like protein
MRPGQALVALAAMGATLAAATAQAGTASMSVGRPDGTSPTVFRYQAGPGEENYVGMSLWTEFSLSDRTGVDTVPPCARPFQVTQASCPPAPGPARVEIRLDDRDDHASVAYPGHGAGVHMWGGPGNDHLDGGEHLEGGPGEDYLSADEEGAALIGGPGADEFAGSGGPDALYLGAGKDLVWDIGDLDGRRPVRDVVQLRDGAVDQMACNVRDTQDVIIADAIDFVFGCRAPRRTGKSFTVPLYVYPDNDDHRGAMLTLGCSNDGPKICRGSATVRSRHGRLGERTFRYRRSENYLNIEVNSRIPERALRPLGRVSVRVRSIDSEGDWHRRTFVLPIGDT